MPRLPDLFAKRRRKRKVERRQLATAEHIFSNEHESTDCGGQDKAERQMHQQVSARAKEVTGNDNVDRGPQTLGMADRKVHDAQNEGSAHGKHSDGCREEKQRVRGRELRVLRSHSRG